MILSFVGQSTWNLLWTKSVERILLGVRRLSLVNIIPPMLRRHPFTCHRRYIVLTIDSVVKSRTTKNDGIRGGAVGRGTALQAGRSRVRFTIVSLEFFVDIILPAAEWP
jgi:hypothetical protein